MMLGLRGRITTKQQIKLITIYIRKERTNMRGISIDFHINFPRPKLPSTAGLYARKYKKHQKRWLKGENQSVAWVERAA